MMDEINKTEELSEEDVTYVLEFAKALSGNGVYPSVLTPMLINQRMKGITMNPLAATEETLTNALLHPNEHEEELMRFSEDFENQSQPYKRLLAYLGSMLSYDLTYECTNAKPSEYTGSGYQKDLDIVKEFLDSFDYKKEFAIATREMLRNETFFCNVRFDKTNIVLQEMSPLPTYSMITGRSPETLLYSFNMQFFMMPGVSFDMFDPFYAEKYGALIESGHNVSYNPALSSSMRGNSSWVYWQDIPVGKPPYGWVFKMHPEIATRVPFFTPLFNDLVQQPLLRALQKNINMSVAARLLTGEIPMLKDAAAKVKDQFALNPATAGQFLALVKSAVGDAIKAVTLPLNNVQGIEFRSENEIYSSYMKNALAMSGVNTNLIFTNENRTNNIESQLSVGVDEQVIMRVYPQMNSFLNFHVNQRTKKYKFKFHFEGTNNFTDKKARLDTALELAALGIVLPQKIAAAIGMSPFDFQRQLEEAKAIGFVDNLTPIISGFQMSPEDNGRPKKDDSELTDAGSQTREGAENVGRGGKVA